MKKQTLIGFLSTVLVASQSLATLTPTYERGEKNVYHTSPRGIQEVCVIPAKHPLGKYTKKDKKKEIEMCNYSFYSVTAEEEANGIKESVSCAKSNSTNPAVNVYKINKTLAQTREGLKDKNCEGAKKIGKYKNSTSCSYTPSIIGYYHLSRILGRIGKVPVSVLRTMDAETHKAIAAEGKKITGKDPQSLIYQTWSGIAKILNDGPASSRKDLVFTDDFQQSYGGFIVNPKDETFYSELFTRGTDRAVAFRDQNKLMSLVSNSASLDKLVSSKWDQSNVQKLFAMRDISHFILMDHIMDQQDRFGNIAKVSRMAYMVKEDAQSADFEFEIGDSDDFKEDQAAGLVDLSKPALQIDEMVLKDNDCGVSKTNVVKAAGLLAKVAHMSPKTYKKLLEFNASLNNPDENAINDKFFMRNLMFTAADYKEMKANVADAVKILQGNCRAGKLKLDLDVDHYLETGTLKNGSCELETKTDVN